MGVTLREEAGESEPTACPVCVSKRTERARTMDVDYRCPDCSALFDGDERIVADPRHGRLDDHGPDRPEG
jgi:predicted RNA-binding Zn-ribbon protein involved in translation (DUF1610 family)